MQTKPRSKYFALLMALGLLFALWGCNGNNNDSDSSMVQGNVAEVMTVMNDVEAEPAQMAHWTDFLTLVATAHAQGEDLSGIIVTATIDGVMVDDTVTDAEGNFTLNVSNGGEVILTFVAGGLEMTLTIMVPDGGDVTLTVTLQPDDEEEPVIVDAMSTTHHPIRCGASDTVTLSSESDTLVIDGGGDSCIRAAGQCRIETDENAAFHIEFMNCDQCIRAEGGATIDLFTEGWVSCDMAAENGIRARGNSMVAVEVGEWMSFTADAVGVDARGNSTVVLSLMADDQGDGLVEDPIEDPVEDPAGDETGDEAEKEAPEKPIWVMGGEADIHAKGNATVEIIGECHAENIAQGGNASVMQECQL